MPATAPGTGAGPRSRAGTNHAPPDAAGRKNPSPENARRRPWRRLCLLLTLLPAPAPAITEAQFIEKVLARDKLLEEAQIGLDIKQIELDASRDNYANWKVELEMDVEYARRNDKQMRVRRSSGNASTTPYTRIGKSADSEVSLEFDKRFLSNPGSVSFGVSRSKESNRNARYRMTTYDSEQRYGGYVSTYYAQINYPLLKRDSNAESLKSYKRNIHDLRDQQLVFLETKEDFLNDRLDDYLSWVLYHRQVEINHELLLELQQLHPTDDAEAALLRSAIAQTENSKRDAAVQKQAIVERLAILLDDATLVEETPQFDLQKRAELLKENARAWLARHSRDLKRIKIDMSLNQLEIDYHRNRLLPSLDLTLRAEKEFDRAGTASTKYDDDTTDYEARLEFSYPLGGGVTTKAELAERALSTRRLEIAYAERLENIEGDLQRLTSLLDFDARRLLDAIAAAAQSTRLERQKYDQTRASIRDLLQAYRDQRTAKLDHIEALIAYQMRSIEYDNLLDRMIPGP